MRIDEFSLEAGICQWDKKMIKIRYLIWSNINFAWNCEFQAPLRVAHPKKMRCLSGLCEGTNEIQANCSRACFKLKCIRYSFRDKLPFFYCQRATSDNVASLGANYCAHDRRSRSVALPSNMPYQIYLRHVILPAGDAAGFLYIRSGGKNGQLCSYYTPL